MQDYNLLLLHYPHFSLTLWCQKKWPNLLRCAHDPFLFHRTSGKLSSISEISSTEIIDKCCLTKNMEAGDIAPIMRNWVQFPKFLCLLFKMTASCKPCELHEWPTFYHCEISHVCNSDTDVMWVTKHFLNGFKPHSTKENASLFLYSGQEPMVG